MSQSGELAIQIVLIFGAVSALAKIFVGNNLKTGNITIYIGKFTSKSRKD
ncbi:hypothetical protein [Ferrimonas kyonanensis]|nr:hypothetical protein [Ferrimonas kyonanensis]